MRLGFHSRLFQQRSTVHNCVLHAALQLLSAAGQPMYSVGLMPSNTYALEMTANSTGSWNYYCNILDHITAGMKARMVVN